MARHRKLEVDYPEWLDSEQDACTVSVAQDVYYAKALALREGAEHLTSCRQLMEAGEKSLSVLESMKADSGKRCHEGDRAARKFWEAKVCARQSRFARRRRR